MSADGSRVVMARKNLATNENDLWLTDISRPQPLRFTFDPASDIPGRWLSYGERIVWRATRNGRFDLYEKAASNEFPHGC